MLNHLIKAFSLVLFSFYCASAAAQAKWYSVEYIVFEHALTGSSQEPTVGETEPAASNALRLLPANGNASDWTSYRKLRAEEMSLFGAQRSLNKSVRYTPRLHAGWIQQLDAEDLPQPVQVSTGVSDTPIQGTITFRRGRFLHLDIDLTLDENPVLNGAPSQYVDDLEAKFRLKQSRRIRTEQLHYFDHPRMGVLVKVMPLTPPVVEEPPVTPTNSTPETGAAADINDGQPGDTPIPLPAAETSNSDAQ